MSNLFRNLTVVLCLIVLAGAFVGTAAAEVLCDFENGTNSYDNESQYPQTTGLFRDTYRDTDINLSNNGEANDYLIFSDYPTGNPTVSAYDTTPSSAAEYSLFKTPVGATTIVTVDAAFHEQVDRTPHGGLFIFDPKATGGGSEGFGLTYLNLWSNPDPRNEWIRTYEIGSETLSSRSIISTTTALGDPLDNPIVRFTISLTNNGSSATIATQVDRLDALEGSVVSNLYSATAEFTYGAGSGQLNMDPVNNGFEILLASFVGRSAEDNDIYFDYLTVETVVPEPSTFALLATGLFGLLAYAWRKRK